MRKEAYSILDRVYVAILNSNLREEVILIGAYALRLNIKDSFIRENIRPVTLDLDFDLNINLYNNREEIKELIKSIIKNALSEYYIEIKKCKFNENSLTIQIKFNVYSNNKEKLLYKNLGIDLSFKNLREDEIVYRIQNIERALITKLYLETKDDSTRRNKDLVDIYKILRGTYINGITKNKVLQLLNYYNLQLIHPEVWLDYNTYEKHIESIDKVKSNMLTEEVKTELIVQEVGDFIVGLINPNVPDTAYFYNGLWYY